MDSFEPSILAVVSKRIGFMKKRGMLFYGKCPFHHESSPSFTVNTRTKTFYCYGCGESGNAIDFIMKYHHVGFEEAVHILNPDAVVSANRPSQERLFEINKIAARYYYGNLKKSNPGIEYFKKRKLAPETIKSFGLGYSGQFGKSLYTELKKNNFSDEEILASGLVKYGNVFNNYKQTQDYYDRFWNRVMFPIFDSNGRIIGFGGRVLGDEKPKYLNSPETSVFDKGSNLYGLNLVPADSPIMLVEGYMDVISMHQAGFNYAVASLGTALTSSQAELISKRTGTVYISYDSDDPGVNAAIRAIPILMAKGCSVKVVNLSPAKDPDEFLKTKGNLELQRRIDSAISGERFLVQHQKNEEDFYEKVADFLTGAQ